MATLNITPGAYHCRFRADGKPWPNQPIGDRLWGRVERSASECWVFTGRRDGGGYGELHYLDRDVQAHRLAWMLTYGPIPAGVFVCHNCPDGDNPACINPAHLWLGTVAQNNRDCRDKGRNNYTVGLDARHTAQRAETRCRNGHAYDGENVERWPDGTRRCRVCVDAKARRYRESHRAEIGARMRARRERSAA